MSIFESIILAIVEGLTEFLPVSSTGHLVIASGVMGIAELHFTKTFNVAIQLGAILAVATLYWKKFVPTKDTLQSTVLFYTKLLIAFVPVAILGLLLEKQIDQLLGRPEVVAFTLVLGGVVLLFIDRLFSASSESEETPVSYKKALNIGLFQTLALFPGVSRSAATIIGGMTQKLSRKSAAEFSFFLAVPTMFAATAFKLMKFFLAGNAFGQNELLPLLTGIIVSYFVAMLAIRSFIGYLTRHGFVLFGWYRIALGAIILILYATGVPLSIN